MNYSGLNLCDTTNGDGCRVSLFVSGCTLHCKGCFNKEAWDFNYGKPFNMDEEGRLIVATLSDPNIQGLSILGGDPFEYKNISTITSVCINAKLWYPDKDIWVWTGRKFDLIKDLPCLDYIDVLVVNPFVERLKIHGRYYGSSNQRVLRKHGHEWIADDPEVSATTDSRTERKLRIEREL